MDIKDKPTRATLKGYFVKNAIPTEVNFSTLIDGMINQKDDGIAKLPGESLCLQPDSTDSNLMKVLSLYKSFSDPQPEWTVSLSSDGQQGWNLGDKNGSSKLFVDKNSGKIGIQTTAPVAELDVMQTPRKDLVNHPKSIKGLYVTGNFAADSDGVEFRHTNGTQGIGFGYNTIYATGSNKNQNLNLKTKGGTVHVTGNMQLTGVITPSAGNGENFGIMFPKDPFGGGGDAAWIRYYSRQGESGTLEIGISNDADDHIALMSSGNVGIGIKNPSEKLEVKGRIIADNIFAFQSGREVITHTDNEGFLKKTGERVVNKTIKFPANTFSKSPKVIVGITGLDVGNNKNTRVRVFANNINKNEFILQVETWGDTNLYEVDCNWMAYGN